MLNPLLLLAFEQGEMSEEEAIRLFQALINSGEAWRLPGCYGRTASWLLEEGLVMLGEEPTTTYYGTTMPSRFQVPPGAPGSPEHYEQKKRERTGDPVRRNVEEELS